MKEGEGEREKERERRRCRYIKIDRRVDNFRPARAALPPSSAYQRVNPIVPDVQGQCPTP